MLKEMGTFHPKMFSNITFHHNDFTLDFSCWSLQDLLHTHTVNALAVNDITLEFHCFDWVKLNIQDSFDQIGNMNIKVIM